MYINSRRCTERNKSKCKYKRIIFKKSIRIKRCFLHNKEKFAGALFSL